VRSVSCTWRQGAQVSWLSLKTKVDGLSMVWPQNHWDGFLRFVPQNRQLRFGDLSLKITVTVSWFGTQNQAGFSLSVAPQNRWEDAMVWDTRRDLAACFAWI
jgi:hypothetical protein